MEQTPSLMEQIKQVNQACEAAANRLFVIMMGRDVSAGLIDSHGVDLKAASDAGMAECLTGGALPREVRDLFTSMAHLVEVLLQLGLRCEWNLGDVNVPGSGPRELVCALTGLPLNFDELSLDELRDELSDE